MAAEVEVLGEGERDATAGLASFFAPATGDGTAEFEEDTDAGLCTDALGERGGSTRSAPGAAGADTSAAAV